jgi:hypothetical protein
MAKSKSKTWKFVKLLVVLGVLCLAGYGAYVIYQPYSWRVNRSLNAAERAMGAAQKAW